MARLAWHSRRPLAKRWSPALLLAGQGWRRVAPTAAVAPSRIARGIGAALAADEALPMFTRIDADWLRQMRNRWKAADNAWNQWVLGYNPQRQRELLSRLGFDNPDWRSMTVALVVLCATMLLLIAWWALYQRQALDSAQRAWQRYCQRIAAHGIRRAEWEGPPDFAARVARERPELGDLTKEAAGHYADLRYGLGDRNRLHLLRQCSQQLRRPWRKKA